MAEIKSHNTLVVGFDGSKPAFVKSFDHPEQDAEMRETIKYVTSKYWPFFVGDSMSVLSDLRNTSEE